MKHRTLFIAALWWVLACLIAGIFLIGTSEKEGRISDTENRMLQGFPKLSFRTIFNDEFTTGFESFLSDSFFGRDDVISFTDGVLGVFSLTSEDESMAMAAENMEMELQSGNLKVENAGEEAPAQDVSNEETAPVFNEDEGGEEMIIEEDEAEEEETVVLAEGELPRNFTKRQRDSSTR